MSLTVEVPPAFAAQLNEIAAQEGLVPSEYAHRAIEKQLQIVRNQKAIIALESLYEGDEAEQCETMRFLQAALEEDRPSERKLFS